jgi:hypothetical protein
MINAPRAVLMSRTPGLTRHRRSRLTRPAVCGIRGQCRLNMSARGKTSSRSHQAIGASPDGRDVPVRDAEKPFFQIRRGRHRRTALPSLRGDRHPRADRSILPGANRGRAVGGLGRWINDRGADRRAGASPGA